MSSKNKRNEEQHLKSLESDGFGPLTIDDFLGGRIRLIQTKKGYRAGQDAVLLAAAVPARKGDMALDVGTGTGAAALCLASRCAGVTVTGLEIQASLVRLARENCALNGCEGRVNIIEGSLTRPPGDLEGRTFGHVFANPPFLEEERSIRPPAATKDIAYVGHEGTLRDWVEFSLSRAKPKGTVTFIFRADRIGELISLIAGRLGDMVLFPLWPREGEAAKRFIVQGRSGLAGGATLAPGQALHGAGERYTKEAEAVLRAGAALPLNKPAGAKKA